MRGRESNWRYLVEELDFDIALLQEATYPTEYENELASIIHQVKGKKPWGSAIVARTKKISTYNNLEFGYWGYKLKGSFVVGQLQGEQPLWLAAIHAKPGVLTNREFIRNPLNNMLVEDVSKIQEITVIRNLLAELLIDKRFIVGGDLNAAPLRDKQIFELLSQQGFFDARKKFYDLPQQTFFKDATKPSALDHIFSDAKTHQKLTGWQVLTEVAADLKLSDHAPVLTHYKL